jgi:23S rRNA (adenine2503-C2)-methyltransferase
MNDNISIFSLNRDALASELEGNPRFRADQIFDWLYKKLVFDPDAMLNLPIPFRNAISEIFNFALPEIAEKKVASDETEKYRLLLADGRSVECVMMPDLDKEPGKRGVSMCITSQVGCALKCDFCATGTMGLIRDLTVGEIVSQVVVMLSELAYEPTRVNIIYMGMGEPLLNLKNVITSLEILNDEKGACDSDAPHYRFDCRYS